MEEIFSTSLFHYTRHGYETIRMILETGFKVSYCQEVNLGVGLDLGADFEPSSDLLIVYGGGYYSGATHGVHWLHIPMVSFCDLPTTRIEEHLSKYGQECKETSRRKAYGIGLNQKWAAKNNLKQVSYEYINNETCKKYKQVYQPSGQVLVKTNGYGSQRVEIYFPPKPIDPDSYWIEDNKGNKFPFELLYKKPINVVKIINTGRETIKTKSAFRGETEWRYIPKDACILASYSVNAPSMNRMLYDSVEGNLQKAKDEHKENVGYQNLAFEPEDVEVIVVDSDKDKDRLKSELGDIGKGKGWSPDQISVLVERVVSYCDIKSERSL